MNVRGRTRTKCVRRWGGYTAIPFYFMPRVFNSPRLIMYKHVGSMVYPKDDIPKITLMAPKIELAYEIRTLRGADIYDFKK